jgi:rhodanese-related sulfurtransferase
MMAPFQLAPLAHTLGYDLIFLAIGLGFGIALEISGFGDSRKLAAQFYLREMTVLKVMFTAIVVAAVLIFLASAFGLLDFSRVWVNPTYLAPGIVGGLVMGVGFIVGGFCPGTSLVAAATLKLDGIFFVLGVGIGVFLFGETVHLFEPFFLSTSLGRLTIPDWLGVPYGVVVVGLVLMALAMFWAAEVSEAFFGAGKAWKDISRVPRGPVKIAASGALVLLSLVVAVKGQPTVDDRYARIATEAERQVQDREVQADPAEVVDLQKDLSLRVEVLDLRDEAEFNRFHLAGARRITPEDARDPAFVRSLLAAPDNTILFLASGGEDDATRAWRDLKAQGVLNLYVLAGGINGWLDRYPPDPCVARRLSGTAGGDAAAWRFAVAVGDRSPSAHPDVPRKEPLPACALGGAAAPPAESAGPDTATHHDAPAAPAYARKVKLQRKVVAKGGCG